MSEFISSNPDTVKCPVCNSTETIPIFKKDVLPLYNLERHYTRESALNARKGNVDFYFCLACQFAFNAVFDSSLMDYWVDYESGRSYSKYFVKYIDSVCRSINDVFSIADQTIVEIGCGNGDFLIKLRELFEFQGIGFDPSCKIRLLDSSQKDLTFISNYYDSAKVGREPDLIILRHILEHQGRVIRFLKGILIEQRLKPKAIYIEVPGFEWIVKNKNSFLFSYEHPSYFTKYSLRLALDQKTSKD
ncbi:class I SAM-dependent methyltransferase [candidate division KSB1 bacterium]|nr:class I SAM-dependent methyltransferase [candidate division KSB1 bacterium]